MEKDEFQELMETKALAEQQPERMRTPVTILFSDIRGSTSYFEKHGDMAGMAMFERHNDLLFPVIQDNGGFVVKTIGDAIMARFSEPESAVRAAIGMQRALAADNGPRTEEDQIHIRIGVHTGLGVIKDDDVFGDVVNAAARIQQQTQPDQILISEMLLEAAKSIGVQCANFGKAELRGKDEAIDLYAVAWSEGATEQLIDELQARYESKLKEARRQREEYEEEFESARDQWRDERRRLIQEIDHLEEMIERVRETARAEVSEDRQSEIRFELEEARRQKDELQKQFAASEARWQAERDNLRAQITSMQASVIDAMERSNNPTRMALSVREQVDARMSDAKHEWNLQFESERRRLLAEIERLKKNQSPLDQKKDVARRALLEKLGKIPKGSAPAPKTAAQWEREFEEMKIEWEAAKDEAAIKVTRLQKELQRTQETLRAEAMAELRGQYELKIAEANREREALDREVQSLRPQLEEERRRFNTRLAELERTIPQAQEVTRKQVNAELQEKLETEVEEANRLRVRAERKLHDLTEELESERLRSRRIMTQLEQQLKEAKEIAFKAQRQARGNL
jgi:class 3 adenylate cyclase